MIILLDGASVFVNNWQLIVGMLLFVTIPFLLRIITNSRPASVSTNIFLTLFFSVTFLLRLAYVSQALLPPYFDSAAHYMVIRNIMANDLSAVFESLRTDYYHMGFHFITAFFASVFQAEISTVMLVLGQIILTVLPLPFFFIVRYITNSSWVGIFAAVLSAFSWYMPAHAVDWGKYPALLSLYLIMLVLALAYFLAHSKDKLQKGKHIFLLVLLGFSIFFAAFVHSRSVIVFGVIAIAWVISTWWKRRPQLQMNWIFLGLFITLIFEIVFVQRQDILSLLFDPYLKQGILVSILVILLSIFAYKTYPQLTFINLISVCLLLMGLFIPVRGVFPTREYLTLMDRPYVEMILFMPLSMIGGLGLAGLEKWIKNSIQKYIVFASMGLILIHAFVNYEFYPSECCAIVGNDDVVAMTWMADQLPVDARIGIASTALKVVVDDIPEGDVGADAGIWITPLIDRMTIMLPSDFDFDQQAALNMICQKNISHIFVGELGQPFDLERLHFRPAWYRPLLSMPGPRVYEVTGCGDV